MIERVTTIPRTGSRVTWDGSNPDEVRSVAGERFLGIWETMAMVRGMDEATVFLKPGWFVVAWDDSEGDITIYSPAAQERKLTTLP